MKAWRMAYCPRRTETYLLGLIPWPIAVLISHLRIILKYLHQYNVAILIAFLLQCAIHPSPVASMSFVHRMQPKREPNEEVREEAKSSAWLRYAARSLKPGAVHRRDFVEDGIGLLGMLTVVVSVSSSTVV